MEQTISTRVYWIGIIGLFLLLCFSILSTQIHLLPAVLNAKTLLISRLFFWGIVLLTLLYASKIEKGNLLIWNEVHYTPGKSLLLLLLTILAMYGAGIIGAIITKVAHTNQESEKMAELIPIFRNNPLLLVFTCLTAGVTEEVLIRGYMMSRLSILLKKTCCRHYHFICSVCYIARQLGHLGSNYCAAVYRTCTCLCLLEISKYENKYSSSFHFRPDAINPIYEYS